MAPGHARRGRAKSDLSPFTLPWVPASAGMTGECAGMTGARGRGDDGGGGQSACFVFLWVPACAGMTGECAGIPRGRYASAPRRRAFGLRERGIWRVKSPGRYLVRSCRVNGLGFAPPPWNGGGNLDRVSDRACYQQSPTDAMDASGTGPRWGGLPDSRQKSSACVVRRQDVKHAPRIWLRMR